VFVVIVIFIFELSTCLKAPPRQLQTGKMPAGKLPAVHSYEISFYFRLNECNKSCQSSNI